jgi:EAL and modified HD-GYP domain-containing signal transduction protein
MTASAVGSGAVPGPRDADELEPITGRAGLVRNVRVGRQGIYRADRSLVAYELLFRAHTEDGKDGLIAGERATSQVIASTFGTFGLDNISDGRPVFINFTRAFLTGVIPVPVEPERVVIEVVEHVVVDSELLLGLGQLKSQGYRIAVDDYRGEVERTAMLELADYVKIDANGTSPLMLPGLVQRVHEHGATLVATDVQDAETF